MACSNLYETLVALLCRNAVPDGAPVPPQSAASAAGNIDGFAGSSSASSTSDVGDATALGGSGVGEPLASWLRSAQLLGHRPREDDSDDELDIFARYETYAASASSSATVEGANPAPPPHVSPALRLKPAHPLNSLHTLSLEGVLAVLGGMADRARAATRSALSHQFYSSFDQTSDAASNAVEGTGETAATSSHVAPLTISRYDSTESGDVSGSGSAASSSGLMLPVGAPAEPLADLSPSPTGSVESPIVVPTPSPHATGGAEIRDAAAGVAAAASSAAFHGAGAASVPHGRRSSDVGASSSHHHPHHHSHHHHHHHYASTDSSAAMQVSHDHAAAAILRQRKQLKKRLALAAAKFNSDVKGFIPYAQDLGLLPAPATPASVAKFLRDTPGLDRAAVGLYISEPEDAKHAFNTAVRAEYVASFDFTGQRLDEALRTFLESFRLPGEAQKIERLMQVRLRLHGILGLPARQ